MKTLVDVGDGYRLEFTDEKEDCEDYVCLDLYWFDSMKREWVRLENEEHEGLLGIPKNKLQKVIETLQKFPRAMKH